jgi:proline iminopeptidase
MFPPIEPFKTGHLAVDDGNSIYWELSGNPTGKPALFLHGGPGAGNIKGFRKMFDPQKYLIIYMDQRGCGQSLPLVSDHADLTGNHTYALISDIEALRNHLGIEKWMITGGSWGTTLALAYAQTFPNRVTEMVLSSVTVTSHEEVHWITEEVGNLFPAEWDAFALAVQNFPGDRLIDRYHAGITSSNAKVRMQVADAWCTWENIHISLDPNWKPLPFFETPEMKLRFATFVIHYWKHSGFLSEKPILSNMAKLSGIPAVLIHGRLDVSLPVRTAWELHKRWPESRLFVIPDEGHGGPKMSEQMCQVLSEFASGFQ